MNITFNRSIKHGIKQKVSTASILALLPGLFYLGNLFRMLSLTKAIYNFTIVVVGAIGFITAILVDYTKKYRLTSVWGVILFYLLTLSIEWVLIRNISLTTIGLSALLAGIALLMLLYPCKYKTGVFIFTLSSVLLIFRIITTGSRAILTSSSNYVSIVILLAVFFYYSAIENSGRKFRLIDILPALVCFILSVWAEGRGGILSCLVLLVMLLFLYAQQMSSRNMKRTILLVLLLLIVGVILYFRNISLVETFMNLGKWRRKGTDNRARILIWSAYLSKVGESADYLFFGAPLDKIPIIAAYGGNTHNSFLQLHAYNGLIMLALTFILIVKSSIYLLKRNYSLTLIMMITIIIRGMTDKFIFGQYGMPIIFYCILFPFVDLQRMKKADSEKMPEETPR